MRTMTSVIAVNVVSKKACLSSGWRCKYQRVRLTGTAKIVLVMDVERFLFTNKTGYCTCYKNNVDGIVQKQTHEGYTRKEASWNRQGIIF